MIQLFLIEFVSVVIESICRFSGFTLCCELFVNYDRIYFNSHFGSSCSFFMQDVPSGNAYGWSYISRDCRVYLICPATIACRCNVKHVHAIFVYLSLKALCE